MSLRLALTTALVAQLLNSLLVAQGQHPTHELTSADVELAISAAANAPQALRDSLRDLSHDADAPTIRLVTPFRFVVQQAIEARVKMLPFTTKDVSAEMRQMWVIVSTPPTPQRLESRSQGSIVNIVVRTPDRSLIVQPSRKEESGSLDTVAKNLPIANKFHGMSAYFRDADIRKVAGADLGKDFTVTVVIDGAAEVWNVDYQVRQKQIQQLQQALR